LLGLAARLHKWCSWRIILRQSTGQPTTQKVFQPESAGVFSTGSNEGNAGSVGFARLLNPATRGIFLTESMRCGDASLCAGVEMDTGARSTLKNAAASVSLIPCSSSDFDAAAACSTSAAFCCEQLHANQRPATISNMVRHTYRHAPPSIISVSH
jgi:hypothetical protein